MSVPMQFYSPLSAYKILRNCLKNLENCAKLDSPAILRLKRAILIRLVELKTEIRSEVTASQSGL